MLEGARRAQQIARLIVTSFTFMSGSGHEASGPESAAAFRCADDLSQHDARGRTTGHHAAGPERRHEPAAAPVQRSAAGARSRSLAAHRALHPMLQAWRRATRGHESFDPAHSERTLSLYATDYVQYRLLPLVIPSLAKDAPHLHLQIQPARPLHGLSMLETNHVELIAGYFPEPSPELRRRFPYEEPAVCIVHEGHHCLRKRWDLDAYLRCGHGD